MMLRIDKKLWGRFVEMVGPTNWGNISVLDNSSILIKPSGYVFNKNKNPLLISPLHSNLKPSVDLPIHQEIYKANKEIKSIVHTHSDYATAFAQARKEITVYGTTHADFFCKSIPLTKKLSLSEIKKSYELNTGLQIKRLLEDDPSLPGCLVSGHGVFAWGKNPNEAIKNSLIIEKIAKLNYLTLIINKELVPLEKELIKKHYDRKNGKFKYYGQ